MLPTRDHNESSITNILLNLINNEEPIWQLIEYAKQNPFTFPHFLENQTEA